MWEMLQDGELKIWYSRRSLKKVVIRCEAAQDVYTVYIYIILISIPLDRDMGFYWRSFTPGRYIYIGIVRNRELLCLRWIYLGDVLQEGHGEQVRHRQWSLEEETIDLICQP